MSVSFLQKENVLRNHEDTDKKFIQYLNKAGAAVDFMKNSRPSLYYYEQRGPTSLLCQTVFEVHIRGVCVLLFVIFCLNQTLMQ